MSSALAAACGRQHAQVLKLAGDGVFNKRKNLFALNLARKSKQGYILLTEGYMDAISLYQYGFDCAVASWGLR